MAVLIFNTIKKIKRKATNQVKRKTKQNNNDIIYIYTHTHRERRERSSTSLVIMEIKINCPISYHRTQYQMMASM